MAKLKKAPLPEEFRQYFWDVRFEDLTIEKDKDFVIERVLNQGTTSHVKWVIDTYGKGAIKKAVLTNQDFNRPTGNFWALILGIDPKRVPSLQKPYVPRKLQPLTAEYLNKTVWTNIRQ